MNSSSYESMLSVLLIPAVFFLVLALHILLPGRHVTGYCCDNWTFNPLKYKLNGLWILLFSGILFLFLPTHIQQNFYEHFWIHLFVANIIGVLMSVFFFVIGGGRHETYARCVTKDQVEMGRAVKPLPQANEVSEASRFFLGTWWNPRYYGIDIKMLLYNIGATGLLFNLLSCLSINCFREGGHGLSLPMFIYSLMLLWFLVDYVVFERVHLYTYDLFAEKIGFKLSWGCLVFYPFFYNIGAFPLVLAPRGSERMTTFGAVAVAILFLTGWSITRLSNLQKFSFRVCPQRKTFFFGLVEQRVIPESRILCSGWWGIARHFNYFGEIIQAVAISIPALCVRNDNFSTHSFGFTQYISLLYPLYYILLFIPREADDDLVCSQKYGEAWLRYKSQVKWRICPGVW